MAADDALLTSSSPWSASLLDRHLATTKEWFPHELVPWSRGRDFVAGRDVERGPDSRDRARPRRCAARCSSTSSPRTTSRTTSATIERLFGRDGAWGEWARRWTAEEGRHSIVHPRLPHGHAVPSTRSRSSGAACTGRASGEVPAPDRVAATASSTSTLQELATRIAHRNTGKLLDDPAGYEVMARVAADENLHHLFYRDLASAAHRARPVGDGARDRAPGARASRCPAPASRTSTRHAAAHRPRRHLRPHRPPRADPRAGRDAPLEGRGAHRPERRGREGPRSAPAPTSSAPPRVSRSRRAATRASGRFRGPTPARAQPASTGRGGGAGGVRSSASMTVAGCGGGAGGRRLPSGRAGRPRSTGTENA